MGCRSSKSQVAPVERSNKPECCIIGPPGSVKGRICELLEKRKDEGGLGIRHISLGEAHRSCVRKNDSLGPKVKEALQQKFNKDQEAKKNGERPDPRNGPDPELNAQVLAWMFKEEAKEGWILEGYPRTREEADALKKQGIALEKLVVVNIADAELVELATGRRMDLTTNTMYHIQGLGGWSRPPDDEQVQARLVQRKDDSREKVMARLSDYKEAYLHVESLFERAGVRKVDGRRPPEDIVREVRQWIEKDAQAVPESEPVQAAPLPATMPGPADARPGGEEEGANARREEEGGEGGERKELEVEEEDAGRRGEATLEETVERREEAGEEMRKEEEEEQEEKREEEEKEKEGNEEEGKEEEEEKRKEAENVEKEQPEDGEVKEERTAGGGQEEEVHDEELPKEDEKKPDDSEGGKPTDEEEGEKKEREDVQEEAAEKPPEKEKEEEEKPKEEIQEEEIQEDKPEVLQEEAKEDEQKNVGEDEVGKADAPPKEEVISEEVEGEKAAVDDDVKKPE